MPISGTLIKKIAVYFAQNLGFVDFRASSRYLYKFKLRHNITFKVICGKSADVPEKVCDMWKLNVFSVFLFNNQ